MASTKRASAAPLEPPAPKRPRAPPWVVNRGWRFRTVKVKLNSILRRRGQQEQQRAAAATQELETTARTLRQIHVEASHIANAHLLRALGSNGVVALPTLDKTFFDRCVAGAGSSRGSDVDQELARTIYEYRQERRQVATYSAPAIAVWCYSKKEIAASMRANAHTMVVHTFDRRLHAYVRSRCALTSRSARTLIKSAWDDGVNDNLSVALRAWLVHKPTRANIRAHIAHFLRRAHAMQAHAYALQSGIRACANGVDVDTVAESIAVCVE